MSSYYRGLRDRIGSELLLIPGVAAVLRDEHGRILMQLNQDGGWGLPAGAIEPGEAPALAVAREVYEETGLVVRAERVLGVVGGNGCRVTYPNGDCVEYVATVFECRRVGGSLITENDETARLQWFHPDHLPPLAFPYPDSVLRRGGPAAYFEWKEAWAQALPTASGVTGSVVRPATIADAERAVETVRSSITALCVEDHQNDAAMLEHWLSNKTVEHFERWVRDAGNLVVVSHDGAVICGVGLIRQNGHVHLCYVLPDRQRTGVGRAVLGALEAQASSWGLEEIRLTSTTTARAFYERQGYVASGPPVPVFGARQGYPYRKQVLRTMAKE